MSSPAHMGADVASSVLSETAAGLSLTRHRLVIKCDVSALKRDLALMAQAGEGSLEFRDRVLRILDSGEQLVCIHGDPARAQRADEIWVRLELADKLRDLVTTGAANA